MDMEEFYKHMKDDEADEELADEALRNTYDFVIGGYDWENLPETYWMLDNPESKDVLKQLVNYFTETEEYEKCAKLVKLIKKK